MFNFVVAVSRTLILRRYKVRARVSFYYPFCFVVICVDAGEAGPVLGEGAVPHAEASSRPDQQTQRKCLYLFTCVVLAECYHIGIIFYQC